MNLFASIVVRRFQAILMMLLAGVSLVFADPYEENFNSSRSLPEGWELLNKQGYITVGNDKYRGNKGNSVFDWTGNTSEMVITPKVKGIVLFYVRTYQQKKASGSVKVYEYNKVDGEFVQGDEIMTASKEWNKVDTWSTQGAAWEVIVVDCGMTGKHLGILLTKACMDDFMATEGLVEEEQQNESTGLRAIGMNTDTKTNEIRNMKGQTVKTPRKGEIYIVNRKKTILRRN